jgi:hypothetical protein
MPPREGPYCGGKLRRREGTCTQPAGWHTDHPGYGRCSWHGGCASGGVKAAENQRADQQARKALEGITDFAEVTDPVRRLRLLAGRAEAFMQVTGAKVAELQGIRYEGLGSGEQLRAEVGLYERAMTSAARVVARPIRRVFQASASA